MSGVSGTALTAAAPRIWNHLSSFRLCWAKWKHSRFSTEQFFHYTTFLLCHSGPLNSKKNSGYTWERYLCNSRLCCRPCDRILPIQWSLWYHEAVYYYSTVPSCTTTENSIEMSKFSRRYRREHNWLRFWDAVYVRTQCNADTHLAARQSEV